MFFYLLVSWKIFSLFFSANSWQKGDVYLRVFIWELQYVEGFLADGWFLVTAFFWAFQSFSSDAANAAAAPHADAVGGFKYVSAQF